MSKEEVGNIAGPYSNELRQLTVEPHPSVALVEAET